VVQGRGSRGEVVHTKRVVKPPFTLDEVPVEVGAGGNGLKTPLVVGGDWVGAMEPEWGTMARSSQPSQPRNRNHRRTRVESKGVPKVVGWRGSHPSPRQKRSFLRRCHSAGPLACRKKRNAGGGLVPVERAGWNGDLDVSLPVWFWVTVEGMEIIEALVSELTPKTSSKLDPVEDFLETSAGAGDGAFELAVWERRRLFGSVVVVAAILFGRNFLGGDYGSGSSENAPGIDGNLDAAASRGVNVRSGPFGDSWIGEAEAGGVTNKSSTSAGEEGDVALSLAILVSVAPIMGIGLFDMRGTKSEWIIQVDLHVAVIVWLSRDRGFC
jgi:hypothetical protein